MLWYKGLTVMIKWNGKISEEISVFKGTCRGGLSSRILSRYDMGVSCVMEDR